jgi:hypothetical protein
MPTPPRMRSRACFVSNLMLLRNGADTFLDGLGRTAEWVCGRCWRRRLHEAFKMRPWLKTVQNFPGITEADRTAALARPIDGSRTDGRVPNSRSFRVECSPPSFAAEYLQCMLGQEGMRLPPKAVRANSVDIEAGRVKSVNGGNIDRRTFVNGIAFLIPQGASLWRKASASDQPDQRRTSFPERGLYGSWPALAERPRSRSARVLPAKQLPAPQLDKWKSNMKNSEHSWINGHSIG